MADYDNMEKYYLIAIDEGIQKAIIPLANYYNKIGCNVKLDNLIENHVKKMNTTDVIRTNKNRKVTKKYERLAPYIRTA